MEPTHMWPLRESGNDHRLYATAPLPSLQQQQDLSMYHSHFQQQQFRLRPPPVPSLWNNQRTAAPSSQYYPPATSTNAAGFAVPVSSSLGADWSGRAGPGPAPGTGAAFTSGYSGIGDQSQSQSPVRTSSASESEETATALSDTSASTTATGAKRKTKNRVRKRATTTDRASESACVDDEQTTAKARKPTYLVQKVSSPTYTRTKTNGSHWTDGKAALVDGQHERESLQDEIRHLATKRELLKIKSGLPTDRDKQSVANVQAQNSEIEEKIHANLLVFGRLQSMLTRELHSTPVNPMTSYIHLPRSIAQRHAILQDLKETKLRRALELSSNRFRDVDHTKPYVYEERFLTPDGIYHCKRFEIEPFHGLHGGARQLYDRLLYFFANVEISVTETLGNLTIREDSTELDPTIWNHRVISRSTAGFTEELNVVGFTDFYDAHESSTGCPSPLGVVASDWVDLDDLHPYIPEQRVRRDLTSSHTITEFTDPTTQQLVVVHKSCVFLSIHPPQFTLDRNVIDSMRENAASWGSVLARFLRETAHAKP